MKILHINCNYILSSLHQCLIEKLNAAGFSNDVFVATYDKKRSIVDTKEYVKIEECFYKWDRINFDFKQAKILKKIEEDFDLEKYDCIHAYTLFTDGNSAMKLSDKYGIPYVVAVRNTDVNDFFAKRFLLRNRGIEILRKAKKVFFLSNVYRETVLNNYVPEKYRNEIYEKTVVIPNGIDDFWLENQPEDTIKKYEKKDFIRLVYAGRIDRNKNIPTTQKAMKILKKKGINSELLVIGKVDDKTELKKIISEDSTCYEDAKPKEQLIYAYRNADIFVMPSFTESFGLVYAEAMSQGLPVIYSKGQGFDGQFAEGVVGYHVDAHDPEELCEIIIKILRRYNEFPEACMQASKKFRWDNLSKEYLKIYQTITENKNSC